MKLEITDATMRLILGLGFVLGGLAWGIDGDLIAEVLRVVLR